MSQTSIWATPAESIKEVGRGDLTDGKVYFWQLETPMQNGWYVQSQAYWAALNPELKPTGSHRR